VISYCQGSQLGTNTGNNSNNSWRKNLIYRWSHILICRNDGGSSLPIRPLPAAWNSSVFSHTAVLVAGVLVAALLGVRLGMDWSQQAERSVPGAAQTSP